MKRTRMGSGIALGMVALLGIVLIACDNKPLAGDTALAQVATQPPKQAEGGIPSFQLDSAWPKAPSKWSLGSVSSVAIDAQDHVWILHRPDSLPANLRKASAPPVLEFDNAGNFLQAWGGPGDGYHWPHEHGIHIDQKEFVWVVGDSTILKFTKAGKFVMQIGGADKGGGSNTEFMREASGLKVYPKTNELFVSDGYGNRRVVVFDPETGKYKRHWGAYGRQPVDLGPRAGVNSKHIIFYPTDPWRAYAENLQQFDTPHDIAVSNDGLVYVADRGNKRIQVFTVEGKYLKQQFVGVDNVKFLQKTASCPKPPCHEPDIQSRSVAFSADPQQEFLYVAGLPDIYILNRQTMEVLGSFETGEVQAHPPNHHIAVDRQGNLYTAQSGLALGGKPGTAQIYKWVFKGLSTATN